MNDREKNLESELHRRLEKITPELFSQFLNEKVAKDVKCLNCDSLDIAIPQIDAIHVGPPGFKESSNSFVSYTKVDSIGPRYSLLNYEYRLICKNCGFTSHYAVYPV